MIHYQEGKNLNFMKEYVLHCVKLRETYMTDPSLFACVHVRFVYPAGQLTQ